MRLLDKLAFWRKGEKAAGFPAPLAPGAYTLRDTAFVQYVGGGTPSASGKVVNEITAMKISTAFSCIRVLAETIGTLSTDVFEKRPGGDLVEVPDHPLAHIFGIAPNADMTSVEMKEAIITNLASTGMSYSYRGEASLYPIPTCYVEQKRRESGEIFYKVFDRGKWTDLPREEMFVVKGFSANGLTGLSPIACASQTLGVALASEEFQGSFFKNGAAPSWIVSLPGWIPVDQREQVDANLGKLWSGPDNHHRVLKLEGGMTATQATMPLADAQFLELRKLTRDEICGIFGVPPHLVGNLERSTNNNIEHQSLEFVMYSLARYLSRIEAATTRWLFPVAERSRFVLRFNVESLLRADAETRANLHSTYVQNGVMNRNEVRRIERLPRSSAPGMDDFTVQVNLTPVELLSQVAAASARQAPAPAPAPALEEGKRMPSESLFEKALQRQKAEAPALSTKVDIHLPPSIEYQLKQTVDLPSIEKLAAVFHRANDLQAATLKAFEKQRQDFAYVVESMCSEIAAASRKNVEAMEYLGKTASAPKEVRLSDGTVLVANTLIHQKESSQ